MRDLYDPPPAPMAWNPPASAPRVWTRGDVVCLAGFAVLLSFTSGFAWSVEPTLAILVTVGGALVILESWSTALDYLNRQPPGRLSGRWIIFLAALVPWLVGLGIAAMLMMGLFLFSDWLG